jgi:hypothetical protein
VRVVDAENEDLKVQVELSVLRRACLNIKEGLLRNEAAPIHSSQSQWSFLQYCLDSKAIEITRWVQYS